MTNKRRANQILWIECIGFLLIIALSWISGLLALAGIAVTLFGIFAPHALHLAF